MWGLLAKRAEARANDALSLVNMAKQRIDALEKKTDRLNELQMDYVSRLQTVETRLHSISENMMCRRYISHLEELKEKLIQAGAVAKEEFLRARRTHQALEADRVKMVHLTESSAKREAREKAVLEQDQLEKLAITLFNLK